MACFRCASGRPTECQKEPPCSALPNVESEESNESEFNSRKARGNSGKRDSTLKDQQSTGRKRAAVLYPLDPTKSCEWKKLRYAGGGEYPIIGCTNGTQQARHHGPSKNTLDNEIGNVHRICNTCHNRWHTKNDPDYNWNGPFRQHNPIEEATNEDLAADIIYWLQNPAQRAPKEGTE